jgi:hypothetical protein
MYFHEKSGRKKNFSAAISAKFVVSNANFLIFQGFLFLWKIHSSLLDEIRLALSLYNRRVKPIYVIR